MWEESKVPSKIVMSEEEYRDLSHCSYSFLSKLDRMGYRAFLGGDKGGKAAKLGNFVDTYILTPEELEDKFVKVQKHPTGNKKLVTDFVIEHSDEVPSSEDLYEISVSLGLWNTRKKETVLKEFDDEFIDYLRQLIRSKGKIEYSADDVVLAETAKNSLANSNLTDHIFSPEEYNMEALFQVKGLFKLDDLHIKFMVDILVVDPVLKKLYVYDLKTGEEDLDSFEKSFLKWRYDIQYYLYTKGVDEIKESLGYADYTVEPLRFIYISKKTPEIPVMYTVPELDIYEGYTTKYGYKVRGIKELIDDFKFYNSGITVPRRFVEGEGVITLDI